MLLLTCSCASGQFWKDPDYIASNAACWEAIKKEFPVWATGEGKRRALVWMREYDEWSRINEPEIYTNPWKPLLYARFHAQQVKEDHETQQAKERFQRQVAAPVWKKFVDNEQFNRANRESIEEEIRRSESDEAAYSYRRESEANVSSDQAEYDAMMQERRIKKLERAADDAERMRHNANGLR